MFIREYVTYNKKTDTRYITHRLVEAIQTEKGPRQRIIMHLGTLSLPKSEWRKLAKVLESRLAGQLSLFEEEYPTIAAAADKAFDHFRFIQSQREERAAQKENREIVPVDVQSIGVGYSRSLGPELVANSFWDRLGFDQILTSSGFDLKELSLAKSVILARLLAPDSDYGTWHWLCQRTALAEMLPVDLTTVGKDAFYEIADDLYLRKEQLEKGLRDREVTLFSINTTLFLFDLTNTYFEGSCQGNDLAERGKSKEKRSDCPLVTLALVVDQLGFPVFSQIYSGNQSEPKTLAAILDELYQAGEPLFKLFIPTIVMDRGIATKDNIDLLKEREYPYIVIERRPVEKDYIKEFESVRETFERIDLSHKEDAGASGKARSDLQAAWAVYVKKLPFEEGCHVLCYSEGREQKERAINTLQERRFLDDFHRLQQSVAKGNIRRVEKVAERVGRLEERHPAVARRYDITANTDDSGKKTQNLTIVKKPIEEERATINGCYVIETSHKEMTAVDIWRCYMTLTHVEGAFRSLKTDLGMRPVYHQVARRTKSHLFVSVLAYHLFVSIEHSLRLHGDHRRWSTIRKQLSTHQRSTVMFTDADNKIHHIRVSGMPEKEYREIYRLLGVKNPLKRTHRLAGSRL
jgi:transposase